MRVCLLSHSKIVQRCTIEDYTCPPPVIRWGKRIFLFVGISTATVPLYRYTEVVPYEVK